MTLVAFTAESGLATGTALTTGNSAHPDAFTAVTPGAGGTINYSTAQAMHGTESLAVTPASGVACFVEWGATAGASSDAALRFYAYFTGLPSTTQAIAAIRSSGGGAGLLELTLNSTGALAVISDVSAVTAFTTSGSISLNTWYRFEVTLSTPSTSTAVVALDTYAGDDSSAIGTLSGSATGQNFGSSTIGTFRFGRITAAGAMATAYFDDMAAQTASSAPIGPSVAPVIPPTPVGNNRARYLIDYTGSTPGQGGALSYSISQTGGTTTTPELIEAGLWTVVQDTATLTYQVTVTETGGTTATDTVTVPAAATGGTTNISAPLQWVPGNPGTWQ